MGIRTKKLCYDFRGRQAVADSGSPDSGPFVVTDTSAAGSPVKAGQPGGGFRLGFSSTNEAQNLCLSFGDVLSFFAAELVSIEMILRGPASLAAQTQLAFGVASDRNDAIDSIAEQALFRCLGSTDLVCESDDGATNIDDVATGFTLGSAWTRYGINFAERNTTIEPPSVSKGRGSNLGFYAGNAHGSLRRVASGQRFDISAYTGGLQPFVQIQKTTGTAEDYVDVLAIEVEVSQPA
ncbi:MAG: hypothetical protein AAF805_01150 [Planctomycetota bacterium]